MFNPGRNPSQNAVICRKSLFGALALFCVIPQAEPAPGPAALFQKHCAVCHGEHGDGDSRVRDSLNPPPRDFTAPEAAQVLTRERMIHSVSAGRPGTAMMPFAGQLPPEAIAGLVDYIRTTFMLATPPSPGKAIYVKHCAACHGDKGDTAVWARNGLNPPPRNFTTVQAREELTRERMTVSVGYGRSGTAMMPFRSRLTEAGIGEVVDYIRATFMKLSPGPQSPPATMPSEDAEASPEAAVDMDAPMPGGLRGNADKGRVFYMGNCFTCHGKQGDGKGPRAFFNFPRPRDFTSTDSRQRFNRPRLFQAISNGKNGSVMPAWGKVLTPQQIADVAEFVFEAFIKADIRYEGQDTSRTKTGAAKRGREQVTGANRDAREPKLALGRKVYNYRCYFCHGYGGDAKTLASSFLKPKPRDFIAADPQKLSREKMLDAVAHGRPGTAMQGFTGILARTDMEAVVDFVRQTFMSGKINNTRYHTQENGWDDLAQTDAAPFVTGDIPLDTPVDKLDAKQQAGKRQYMSSCVICHDRASVSSEGDIWEMRPLSYPRGGYTPDETLDAVSAATAYAIHDKPPRIKGLGRLVRQGQVLYQNNCAFCHAADGTGRNWIGRFLEPHPRDLTSDRVHDMDAADLKRVVREGLPGTTMPAWKSVLSEAQIDAIVAYVKHAFYAVN